jgi:uncharacterized protein
VLIDTGIFVAAAVRSDPNHDQARHVLERTLPDGQVTTDHVVIETWNLLTARRGRHIAMRFWAGLSDTAIVVECVGAIDLERAAVIESSWADQGFDIVDCTTLAVMERLRIDRVASFDKDFIVYRTGKDRTRAFEIVRN